MKNGWLGSKMILSFRVSVTFQGRCVKLQGVILDFVATKIATFFGGRCGKIQQLSPLKISHTFGYMSFATTKNQQICATKVNASCSGDSVDRSSKKNPLTFH